MGILRSHKTPKILLQSNVLVLFYILYLPRFYYLDKWLITDKKNEHFVVFQHFWVHFFWSFCQKNILYILFCALLILNPLDSKVFLYLSNLKLLVSSTSIISSTNMYQGISSWMHLISSSITEAKKIRTKYWWSETA